MSAIDDGRWHQAAIGLGGNIGDAAAAIAQALARLDAHPDVTVLAVSGLYRTPPWGKTDQDWFFNACAVVQTTLEPLALLDACLDVEKAMKRQRLERWGPRTIDLDVLTYDTITMQTAELTLPHPRMTERGFVLLPLADILPDHVVGGRSVAAWAGDADAAGIEIADGRAVWWRDRAGEVSGGV
ncbi:2-amino-4-hydroxy-6-hydroxymethyldihydropteridine diphosphokinase [Rhizobium sp. PP-F2F-G48]|uniref:2-amino-4-hydroxy-6- hydroxymethyldihydropteridine diphosphokinase n=1 Tax=Rhizobium sp. PP-F2F-G48 TaxID=2135651 RepID=UPI0010476BD5|nr:2-amino-4-hydroxy-6-hydroxymethyldihydropteridine diphosphokinase [Rhizobium sp. PP-F2F-G48]TCM58904.1 2-amino-4-hydroxy-6-hydroxymethyldihydropteridine diphosphokinase [Rhizobium sp. PP-F2F-G48]